MKVTELELGKKYCRHRDKSGIYHFYVGQAGKKIWFITMADTIPTTRLCLCLMSVKQVEELIVEL